MNMIHTLPLFIREASQAEDLNMTLQCLQSLQLSQDHLVILYNQGFLTNEELALWLATHGITETVILGDGVNAGIAKGRQACFEYIWEHYPEVQYISEIHVDMMFPPDWSVPLTDYLSEHEEPIVSPGILTAFGELQPLGRSMELPVTMEGIISALSAIPKENTVIEGFVHPVIHRSKVLQEIGGYDARFLRGKQGYEDDSLLLGYCYYMGNRCNWKPKCCLRSWVYHATMAQRMSLPDKLVDFAVNEQGLFEQYGAYGFKRLSQIYNHSDSFNHLFAKYTGSI